MTNSGNQPSILGPEEIKHAYETLLSSMEGLRSHLN